MNICPYLIVQFTCCTTEQKSLHIIMTWPSRLSNTIDHILYVKKFFHQVLRMCFNTALNWNDVFVSQEFLLDIWDILNYMRNAFIHFTKFFIIKLYKVLTMLNKGEKNVLCHFFWHIKCFLINCWINVGFQIN